MIDTHTEARVTAVLAIALVVGCAGADGESAGETSESESALTSAALEGVLAGGEFRCAEAGKGDVIVKLERTGASRAEAKLSGRVGSYEYPAGDPAVRLRLENDALIGKRDINYGDIGRGYYCGGGGAAMNCGPDRTDSVRIFDVGGEVRCEISVTKDEAYLNHVTQTVTGPLTPYVALPPPAVYGNPASNRVVRHATGYLFGFQVSVPERTTLRHFGLVTTERGPNVVMALYRDVDGLPGSLVAAAAPTPVSGADQHVAVEATPLPAGTYWIFAEFSGNVRMRATQSAATSYSWVAHTFGTPLPTSIPSMKTPRGEGPSLYFVAQ